MDSTYCIGGATHDVFDQYPYKGPSFDLSLNIPDSSHSNRFMGDQGYQAPNIGDEEYDIPRLNLSSNPSPGHYDRSQEVMIDNANQGQAHYQNQFMASMTQHHQPRSSPEYTSPQPVSTDAGVSPNGMYMPMTTAHSMVPPHNMTPVQQQQPYSSPGLINRTSPANSSSGSPTGTHELGSEDSNDEQTGGTKRPSPEPVETKAATASKKPKVPKKKKKRDPNEPQKPVSAYALFFRDTQAAIKGQNPNATFGEVSKIVASMWDALDAESKNVYKKKTEVAKKEYLKALAAYRASLVSKGTTEQEGLYSGYSNYNNFSNYNVPQSSMSGAHQMSPMAKKSPLLTSLMNENGTGNQSVPETGMLGNPMMGSPGAMMRSPQGYLSQSQSPQYHSPQSLYQQQQMMMSPQAHISQPYPPEAQPHQMTMQQLSPQQTLMGQGSPNQYSSPHHPMYHQQHPSLMMQPTPSTSQQSPPPQQHQLMSPQQHSTSPGTDVVPNPVCPSNGAGQNGGCIRAGCTNPAIHHPDWEDEYCSSECVVSHCRDVFNAWVASSQSSAQNYSSTSVK